MSTMLSDYYEFNYFLCEFCGGNGQVCSCLDGNGEDDSEYEDPTVWNLEMGLDGSVFYYEYESPNRESGSESEPAYVCCVSPVKDPRLTEQVLVKPVQRDKVVFVTSVTDHGLYDRLWINEEEFVFKQEHGVNGFFLAYNNMNRLIKGSTRTKEIKKRLVVRHYKSKYPVILFFKASRRRKKREIDLELVKGGIEKNPGPQKNKNGKGKGGGKRRRMNTNQGRSPSGAGTMWLTPRGFGAPDAMRVKLRYIVPLTQLTGGGTTNSFRYTSNAYDVDAALGSTAMAYFAELAAIYSRFRTIKMKYEFHLENQEAFPAQYIVGFMTNALGSTAVGANYAGNRYMRTGVVSAVNGSISTKILRGTVSIASLFGDKGAYYDDLYTGSTTSSTLSSSRTANLYIGTVAAAVPVNGQFVGGYIELDLILDRRNSLIV